MEIAFDAIGIEIKNETAFNNLAEDVEKRGEASRLTRGAGVLHGHCLKLGEGLEIWTVLYESGTGEVSYADCRPAFRARYAQKNRALDFDRSRRRRHGDGSRFY